MFQHSALFPAGQGGSDQHARAQEGLRPQQPAQWSVAAPAAAVMVVSAVAVVTIVAGSVVATVAATVARPVVPAAVTAAVPAVVTGRVPAAPSWGALQAAPSLSSLAECKEVVIVVYTCEISARQMGG